MVIGRADLACLCLNPALSFTRCVIWAIYLTLLIPFPYYSFLSEKQQQEQSSQETTHQMSASMATLQETLKGSI